MEKGTRIAVGIDTGVNTGFAVAINGKLTECLTTDIATAIHKAKAVVDEHGQDKVLLVIEDARLATFGRKAEGHKAQGAGSVKRDAGVWESFAKFYGWQYRLVRPRSGKVSAKLFKAYTGWSGRTSSHARDAGMLIIGL